MSSLGKLTFFCGKMGAGKTTLSQQMAAESHAVLVSEDEWLASLYPNKISGLDDYLTYSNLLKTRIKPLVQAILQAGADVIMDFPANTVRQRQWFTSIFSEIGADHTLVYIQCSDELCLKHIAQRRQEQPARAQTDTPEMFNQVSQYFVEPHSNEQFNLKRLAP